VSRLGDFIGRLTGSDERLLIVEFDRIMVPVFGTGLDDEIVSTAGRLADAALDPGEVAPHIDLIYVIEVPSSKALDDPPDPAAVERGNLALARAEQVADEYETVEVGSAVVRARKVGEGIVDAAIEREVEMIVMGAEPPSRVRSGARFGGAGGARPPEIGPVTEYVMRSAPCRVLLTAPPADPGDGEGVVSGSC